MNSLCERFEFEDEIIDVAQVDAKDLLSMRLYLSLVIF